jgi:hypothetical protein
MIKILTDFTFITLPKNPFRIVIVCGFVFTLFVFYAGYFVQRVDFPVLLITYCCLFVIYWISNHFTTTKKNITFLIVVGIIARVILLFSTPNLSDDVYRFIWDGRLIINGFNPFTHLPSYYIENQILPKSLTLGLYEKLNSPSYFTVYPPVAQGVFALACWMFPNSTFGSMVVMKLILLIGETGSIFLIIKLLQRFQLPEKNVLLYALNPLVIVEIVGNVHLEGLMIFFLLLTIWFVFSNRWILSALVMALAIATKLIPLLFLPFFITKLGLKKSIFYFTVIATCLFVLFFPLSNNLFFSNISSSLNLYFQQFEFNASIYYLVRWIEYQTLGYNNIGRIGPTLAVLTFCSIMSLTFFRKNKNWQLFIENWLFAISIYLLFATTIHPWYLTLPVVLSVFTRWRYALVWSGVVVLSYSHYWNGNFEENYVLIGLEYVIVIITFLYELSKSRLLTAH